MISSYKKFWNNTFDFSGTANKPDYWWPIIINYILSGYIANAIILGLLGLSALGLSN